MSEMAAQRRQVPDWIGSGLVVLAVLTAGLLGAFWLRTSPAGAPPDDVRQSLNLALRAAYPDEAKLVIDKATEVEPYPASFLKKHTIYKVLHYGPYQPIMFYVGYAPPTDGQQGQAYMLSNHLDNYAAMAKAEGLKVDTAQLAEEYVAAGLDVCRSMSYLVYVVKSVDDLMWRGVLDDEDKQLIEQAKEKYRSVITPPKAEPAGAGYTVTVYVARNRVLERHTVSVTGGGELQDQVTVLEKDLPLKTGL